MTRLEANETAQALVRLTQLRDHLNGRYATALAQVMPDPRTGLVDETPCLVVSRGQTPDHVIVAVYVDRDAETYRLAVFTSAAWFEYGSPFVCAERDAVQRAAAYVLQFVPETPCT